MTHRLSVIATRTGDDGTTSLGDGSRIEKDAPRVTALGDVDELNSVIGLWRCEPLPAPVDTLLASIQNHLFDMGAELCIPGHNAINNEHVLALDEALKHYNALLPPLKEFILPGGNRPAALAHLARTVSRRAERSVITLHNHEPINAPLRQYLNRLSDLCFVLARTLNRQDTLWNRDANS